MQPVRPQRSRLLGIPTWLVVTGLLLATPVVGLLLLRAWVSWRTIDSATQAAKADGVGVAAAIERFRSETGAFPDKLESDLVPRYLPRVPGPWYLDKSGDPPMLTLHSNLPEWLLQYDLRSRRWTVETVAGRLDISENVTPTSKR